MSHALQNPSPQIPIEAKSPRLYFFDKIYRIGTLTHGPAYRKNVVQWPSSNPAPPLVCPLTLSYPYHPVCSPVKQQ